MRTTLEIDDDLIAAAKALAHEQGRSLGQVISDLARSSLKAQAPIKVRNGVPLFDPVPAGAKPSLQTVNRLRDDE